MKKIKISGKGRICRFPGCGYILSIYNHDEYCHIHLGSRFEGRREGVKIQAKKEK